MNEDDTELEKAMDVVQKAGCVVIQPLALAAKPYIGELSTLLESGGYRLDMAKIERDDRGKATGAIALSVYPFKKLESLEREGRC
jgi:hypothetical protein